MRTLHLKILLRAALLVAIVASTALLVDYRSASGPSFCGVGSGCSQVRESAFSHIFGIPLPALGLAALSVLFLGAAWSRTRTHFRLLALACGLAAVGGLGLIGIMVFVIKAVCPWCLGVDVGVLVAAATSVALAYRASDAEPEALGQRGLWTGTAVAAVVITLLWGRDPQYKPPPPDVAKLQVPGKVTLVVFTDFECPFCQAIHPLIDELAEQHQPSVAVRLVMVPLPIHLGAEPTARAYLCSDEAHQKPFAHALYGLPYDEMINATATTVAEAAGISLDAMVEQLNRGDKAAIDRFKAALDVVVTRAALDAAGKAGLDPKQIESCMAEPATRATLDEQIAMFRRTELDGLPSTFVGNYLVQGADEPMLRSAVNAAIDGGGLSVRWMFGLLGGLLFAVSALSLMARPPSDGPEPPTGARPVDKGPVKRRGRKSKRPPAAPPHGAAEATGDEASSATSRAPAAATDEAPRSA